jgi:hypothetical protein
VGGVFPITVTASNGVAPATTQSFTLTVNGPPVFTSPNAATFLTGDCSVYSGSYLLTTTAAGSPGATHLTESGSLPAGLTFHDNGDGTATLSGCVNPSARVIGSLTLHLTVAATNPVGQATQQFTLVIRPPAIIALPGQLPPGNGALTGVPAQTAVSQVLHLSGSGFAPGAMITIGYYAGPVTVKTVRASSTGTFATDITVSATGSHTFVAAGIGGNGSSRFLEAVSVTS